MPLISNLVLRRCQDRLMAKEKCTTNLLTISSLTQSSPSNRSQWWERGISYWIKLYWVVPIRLRGCLSTNIGIMWLEWVMSQGLYHFPDKVPWRTIINFNMILLAWRLQERDNSLLLQLIMIPNSEIQQLLIKMNLRRKTHLLPLKSQLMPQLIL